MNEQNKHILSFCSYLENLHRIKNSNHTEIKKVCPVEQHQVFHSHDYISITEQMLPSSVTYCCLNCCQIFFCSSTVSTNGPKGSFWSDLQLSGHMDRDRKRRGVTIRNMSTHISMSMQVYKW